MTILTKNTNINVVWYPAGAGGMWLNYLIWCYQRRRTINHAFPHFEFGYVIRQDPAYHTHIRFARHVDDSSVGTIRLGSNRAWYNFYLNLNVKKSVKEQHYLYAGALSAVENSKKNIPFNLEWTLLWTDPEQFIQDLSSISGIEIKLNQHTELAIEQYRASCRLPKFDQEFCQSHLYKHWHQAIIDTQTDPDSTLAQREDQARAITNSLYWTGR